jgi:hypothetical protein
MIYIYKLRLEHGKMNFIKTVVSLIMFTVCVITGGIPQTVVPKEPAQYSDTVLFMSDFQSKAFKTDREVSLNALLDAVKIENPGLVVCGGDYQSSLLTDFYSSFGISELKKIVGKHWNYDMQYLFVQGNHDPASTKGLNKTGLYEFNNYIVYTINEDDYPWKQGSNSSKEATVKATADKLNSVLATLAKSGDKRPVFIVSHLPLHYTSRYNSADNKYAEYIFDAINNNSSSLNIVYLYGHNHSGKYDDYIGGAINYIGKGSTMRIGGTGNEKTLGFTYTNCGYMGYTANSKTDTSVSTSSATVITVSNSDLLIKKYTSDGLYAQYSVPFNSKAKAAA